MKESPLVSVILPSYNHAKFVTRAVESVLNQSYQNIELIIIDDGSTDGTAQQVERIKDSRIRFVQLKQNQLHHPRNMGLSMAKGRYVAFQNSDDEWLPDKLQIQLEVLRTRKDIVACFTDVELIGDDDELVTSSWANGLFTTENRTNLEWLHHFFTTGNCLCITSAVIRRKEINDVGRFRGSLVQLSDFDLWVRLAATGNFHIIDKKLTRMRVVSGKKENIPQPQSRFFIHRQHVRSLLSTIGRILPAPIKSKIKEFGVVKNVLPEPVNNKESEPRIVSSNNLSSPNLSSSNRSFIELVDVLRNFVRSPILDLLPRIFKNEIPASVKSKYARRAWLAKHAWSMGTIYHSLFADQVMASILENDFARKKVTDAFGAEIVREFIQKRGQLSITVQKVKTE